ncbi:hypothetical protein [Streptomyces sp. RFCAC02]|uniref:hypothetical protein n=1 Tax=Streptomyces sp. RFCAC02 TaxID=2499143 RepID=UPI001020ECC7|nr:hypothetical protein [Streptomyces sp. RFCAC02]
MADKQETEWSVVLTSSPLQRAGAFALAALADVDHPDELTSDTFLETVNRMTGDLLVTSEVTKADEPGGFWLSASYMLWPNSKINPTARKKQSPAERRDAIREWRAEPGPADRLDAPCAYCGRGAYTWFGKVDIPLGASVAHRNTTARGHEGTPLCYPCVASLWAFPYGATLSGGRAALVHSWDDTFLARTTRQAVDRTLRAATVAMPKGKKPVPYARELAVLTAVRAYTHRISAPVELMVLSNSNKEQLLATQEMGQPVAEWLRSTRRSEAAYQRLAMTQGTKQVPGEAFLAKRAFSRPAQVLDFAVGHLLSRISASVCIPDDVQALGPLIDSYCRKVLTMDDKDIEQIKALARRVAGLLGQDDRPGPFRDFIRANTRGGNLHAWFRMKSVDWLLYPRPKDAAPTLLPVRHYRLLFEDERSWSYRRLLVFAVIEALGEAGWQPKGSKEEIQEVEEAAKAVAADSEEDATS